jgi:hypothetical protein
MCNISGQSLRQPVAAKNNPREFQGLFGLNGAFVAPVVALQLLAPTSRETFLVRMSYPAVTAEKRRIL